MTDCGKLVRLGTELGRWLMASGAEIYRTEESIRRLLTAYGTEPEVFCIPNCLIVCVTTPEGESITRLTRISQKGTDIELLERCNSLCRSLCRSPIPVDEALEKVAALPKERKNSIPVRLLGYVLTTFFFALFFDGNLGDAVGAGICGLAVGIAQVFGWRILGSNLFVRTALCSFLSCSLAVLMVRTGLSTSLDAVTVGSLMVLVPGMALTNAMREFMAGDIISGLSHSAEVILISTAIALGSILALILGQAL